MSDAMRARIERAVVDALVESTTLRVERVGTTLVFHSERRAEASWDTDPDQHLRLWSPGRGLRPAVPWQLVLTLVAHDKGLEGSVRQRLGRLLDDGAPLEADPVGVEAAEVEEA